MIQEIGQTFGVKSELRDTWTWLQAGPINTDGAHNPVTSRYIYLPMFCKDFNFQNLQNIRYYIFDFLHLVIVL